MLQMVINLLDMVKNIGYFAFYLSFTTGKIIVNGLLATFDVVHNVLTTICTVLTILNEDLLVFLADVWNRLSCVLSAGNSFIVYVGETIMSVACLIKGAIFGTSNAVFYVFQLIVDVITKVFQTVTTLFTTLKVLVVLFGSGVWFAVTLVPVCVVYGCIMTTYYVGSAFEEIKSVCGYIIAQIVNTVMDLVTFVTDVPVESIAGLIVCVCLCYTLMKFQIVLYRNARRFTRYLLTSINILISRLKEIVAIPRRRPVLEMESETSSDSDMDVEGPPGEELSVCNNDGWMTKTQRRKQILEENNGLCIICLERNKCILAMPCRHMCTCKECNDTLRNYQHTCPICRRYVNYTIHVY